MKQRGLCLLYRICLGDVAIDQPAEPDAGGDERERNEEHRLNQTRDVKVCRLSIEIAVEPRPCGSERNTENN